MPAAPARPRQSVIVVSSHVVRGAVGNRACVFALERLGFPVWAVPTVTLAWHPGHGRSTRIVPDPQQFRSLLADLERAPWLGEVGAVMSGYLGDPAQADAVAALVRAVKARNGRALYLCDPVSGDANGLYVPAATAEAMRDVLLPLADIATPNRFELEWLAGVALPDNEAVEKAARALGVPAVVVTSAHASAPGLIGNLLAEPGRALLVEHEAVAHPPNGTGDLAAALFLARLLDGHDREAALRLSVASVREVVVLAAARGADELMLTTDADSLIRPSSAVSVLAS